MADREMTVFVTTDEKLWGPFGTEVHGEPEQ